MKVTEDYCEYCGGHHPVNSPDCYVDFMGKRYRPPFKCLCCGKIICGQQFAFGRCCGVCDTGACQKYPEHFHDKYDPEKDNELNRESIPESKRKFEIKDD